MSYSCMYVSVCMYVPGTHRASPCRLPWCNTNQRMHTRASVETKHANMTACYANACLSWQELCSRLYDVCPEATRRGLGAALLRKPTKLGRLVAGIAEGIPIPLTVKIRSGESASKINVMQVISALPSLHQHMADTHHQTAHTCHHTGHAWFSLHVAIIILCILSCCPCLL